MSLNVVSLLSTHAIRPLLMNQESLKNHFHRILPVLQAKNVACKMNSLAKYRKLFMYGPTAENIMNGIRLWNENLMSLKHFVGVAFACESDNTPQVASGCCWISDDTKMLILMEYLCEHSKNMSVFLAFILFVPLLCLVPQTAANP